jgi:membrane protease YdiL (CAAX protease family)
MGIWSDRKGVTGGLLRVLLFPTILSYLLYFLGGWIVVFGLSETASNVVGIWYSVFILILLVVAVVHLVLYRGIILEKYLAWVAIVLAVLYFVMAVIA